MTHDELDEAVSGLTSMMDLLSTQILQLDMRVTEQDTAIAEVQQNRVKRCESINSVKTRKHLHRADLPQGMFSKIQVFVVYSL